MNNIEKQNKSFIKKKPELYTRMCFDFFYKRYKKNDFKHLKNEIKEYLDLKFKLLKTLKKFHPEWFNQVILVISIGKKIDKMAFINYENVLKRKLNKDWDVDFPKINFKELKI